MFTQPRSEPRVDFGVGRQSSVGYVFGLVYVLRALELVYECGDADLEYRWATFNISHVAAASLSWLRRRCYIKNCPQAHVLACRAIIRRIEWHGSRVWRHQRRL